MPVLYWLSGLTCTDENFMQKAGAHRMAADLGMMIVAPDTSPRGDDVADDEGYDLGKERAFMLMPHKSRGQITIRCMTMLLANYLRLSRATFQ